MMESIGFLKERVDEGDEGDKGDKDLVLEVSKITDRDASQGRLDSEEEVALRAAKLAAEAEARKENQEKKREAAKKGTLREQVSKNMIEEANTIMSDVQKMLKTLPMSKARPLSPEKKLERLKETASRLRELHKYQSPNDQARIAETLDAIQVEIYKLKHDPNYNVSGN